MKKILFTLISIASTVAWIYALWERFSAQDWLIFIIDLIVPPIGVIDGIGQFLGYW